MAANSDGVVPPEAPLPLTADAMLWCGVNDWAIFERQTKSKQSCFSDGGPGNGEKR